MKKSAFLSVVALLGVFGFGLLSPVVSVAQEAATPLALPGEPTADEIVELVHLSRALKKHELRGTLSKDDKEVPFVVRMESDLVRFYFDSPKQIINLNIKQKGAELTEAVAGSNKAVPAARYAEGIRGTDLTYDDISFRYLYWPTRVKQPNIETVKTRKCWVVDLHAPKLVGEYKVVRIFVDKESGGLMRVMGYDANMQLIKVMAVTSGMKVDGATVLKSMDVIRYVPGTKKVAGETTFELKKPG
jgi:hypothetical protein